jgi:hypothetical protein
MACVPSRESRNSGQAGEEMLTLDSDEDLGSRPSQKGT